MTTVETSYESPKEGESMSENEPVFNMLQPMAFFACRQGGQKIQRDDKRAQKTGKQKRGI
jgi:hypothetical protein